MHMLRISVPLEINEILHDLCLKDAQFLGRPKLLHQLAYSSAFFAPIDTSRKHVEGVLDLEKLGGIALILTIISIFWENLIVLALQIKFRPIVGPNARAIVVMDDRPILQFKSVDENLALEERGHLNAFL